MLTIDDLRYLRITIRFSDIVYAGPVAISRAAATTPPLAVAYFRHYADTPLFTLLRYYRIICRLAITLCHYATYATVAITLRLILFIIAIIFAIIRFSRMRYILPPHLRQSHAISPHIIALRHALLMPLHDITAATDIIYHIRCRQRCCYDMVTLHTWLPVLRCCQLLMMADDCAPCYVTLAAA